MKNKRSRFRVLLALILTVTILTLPLDSFALTGDRSDSPSAAANTATPDEANPDGAKPDEVKPDEVKPEKTAKELSAVGAGTLSGDGSQENPYIVASASDWDALADSVLDGTSYADKYIELTEDISVTRSLGHTDDISSASSPSYEFDGTFDGGGHTMTFTPPADSNANYVAPFSIVKNATIRNLKVEGEITAFNNLSGLVGAPKGTLMVENVLVDVDVEGNFIGGFVGHGVMADMTFRSCAFTGNLNGDTLAGGFVCWRGPVAWEASGNPALHIENCLFAGSASGAADFHPIGFTQQTNVSAEISDMWATADGQNNGKGFYNYQYQGTSYRSTAATVVNGISSSRPWMGYFDVIDCPPVEGSFTDALYAWTIGSTLALLTDVTTDSTITVPTGDHTLDLNGHGIKMTGNGSVFVVGSGSKMIINDSNTDAEHKYTLSNTQSNGAGFATVNDSLTSGYKTFKGGYITGGNGNTRSSWREGGALHITGEVEMNAGTLIGNGKYGTTHGGGFETRDSGRFVMHGGSIQNNGGFCGGGCRLVGGSAEIDGGKIIDNIVTNDGGGIHVGGTLPLVLKDCEISGNYANGGPGAGIWMSNVGTEISGKTVIKDNYVGNKADNIEIQKDKLIGIGNLTDGASIGITMQSGPAVFTSGWKDNMGDADPTKYLTSDNDNYKVFLNDNGEAEIGVPPVASVISEETTTSYSAISDAVNAWTSGSTLKLLADVTTDSTITVPSGEHTLDLNGCGIKMTGNGAVINVGSGVVLDLYDSDTDATHKFDVPDGAGLAVLNEASGNYTVNGGYITGGNEQLAGGVYIDQNGTFNMYGGCIIGNTATVHGGGVDVSAPGTKTAIFNMYGGSICYNSAPWGGGINVFGTAYVNEGCTIHHNTASNGGGGIELENGGKLYLNGSTVTENVVLAQNGGMWKGGGVHIPNGTECHLQGAVIIKDNYRETFGTAQSNVFVRQEVPGKVILDSSLTSNTPIGVGTNGAKPFTVTSAYGTYHGMTDPSKYFTSDYDDCWITLNNNGEAEVAKKPVAMITSGDDTSYYSDLSSALSAWTAGSTLKLLADVTTDSTITVPSGAHTLDLNGYALKAGSTGYSVITVVGGAELTIDDTSDTVGKITGGSVGQNYGGGVTVDGGTLTLKGGAISGNANTYGGIGNCGGGVHVRNSGKFYMEGGEISGNTSYIGGGVCSDASATTVSITGGVIKSNKTDRFGSAIWAGRSSSAVFRIGGDVQIIDNISTWTADKNGEASVNFVGALLLSGNPTVHGDWKANGTSSPNTHINLDNDGSGIQRIELEGALTNDTGSPSITMSPIYRWNDLANGQTFVFTKNWNKYMGTAHPADYFKLDDSVSGVTVIRKDGEAAFTGSGDLGDLYITFDANGGESEMDAQLAKTSSVQLNKNTFTHKDLVFGGWNTQKDGSGTAYADGANITLSGDLTLYAQWKEPVASIISGETTTSYGSLYDAVNAWTEGCTLKLLSDAATSSTITVPTGEHTLDLSGYELKRTGATGSDNSGLAVTVNDGVTLTVIGPGKITGGKGFHGGGIHVEGNSTLVLDNCEISGNTGHYGGGLYLSKGTITLKNGTVVKGNSASEGFGGSGIYAEGGGTLILEDSKFINNEIKNNNQYAVFLAGNANVKVSGAPVINDNTYGGKQKDLYLYQAGDQHSNVQVIGELTDGAKIIVGQTTGTGVIGSGWKANMGDVDPADYLVSADTDYVVFANKDDELEIGYPEITGVSAEGFEGDYDGEAHKISVTAPDGATIKYGTTEGSCTLTENPTYTDAGTYTVYYEVSKNKYRSTYGSADVKINKINATVTITGRSLTVDYDGKAHSADGYDAVTSSNLYDVNKDFTFSGRAEAVRTNAGTSMMNLTADKFENTNSNFATVTFNVTDGYITVNPVDVVVTITGHSDTVDYNGSAHSADGYDAVASSNLYDVNKDFTFSGRAEAIRTNVGTTKMNLSADKFTNTNTNFANVTFNVTDGFLTVNPVDAVITTAPHAKSELIYNGSDQELIAAGAADGGTLYYALGDDAKTAPADESYTTAIPTATQIGNYYIWYMVKGDSNHNDLSASCIKITMADQGWGTVSGAVVDENHSPVKNATVSLIIGGRVIDEIASGSDGSYYFTVPAGIYNIVVKSSDTTVTEMVNVSDRTTYDLTVPDSDTDSVLDIVDTDSRIVVGGLSKEAAAVRNTEGVSADQNVSVRMTVKTVSESDTTGSQAISGIAGDMFVEYYDFMVEKTVDTVTTSMDKTQTVLELVIPCSYTNKRELTVYNSDGSGAQTLTLSDSREAGTFRVDQNAGLVYIYTDRIATYAVGYKPYYSIKSEVSLGSFSGNVSVKLTKDTTGETYALNNVSLNSISFAGLPKGTYSMTITWTDGAENTLTTPFIIK